MQHELRQRMARVVVGYQRWDEILFVHWPVPADTLRRAVDRRLDLDTFDGRAFVSATPFTLRRGRLRAMPALPGLSEFHEVNLRTYVRPRDGGVAGIWFFSLDAAAVVASALARVGLGLPYFPARIARSAQGATHHYRSDRIARGTTPASLDARWTVGQLFPDPPGSLEHFLVERYALYSRLAGRLLRMRVRHAPWVLQEAQLERWDETLSDAAGISATPDRLLAHASAGVDVEFFPPELVG